MYKKTDIFGAKNLARSTFSLFEIECSENSAVCLFYIANPRLFSPSLISAAQNNHTTVELRLLRGDNGIVIRADQTDTCARHVSSHLELLIELCIMPACLLRRKQAFVQERLLPPCQHHKRERKRVSVYSAAA